MSTKKLNDKITLIINSCAGYSDLWEGNIKLLERNWKDRDVRTVLLTDEETDAGFGGIEIFSAGKGLSSPDIIEKFLPTVTTEYIFFTLDDYYLIEPVDSEKILALIDIMDKEKIDYIRLFDLPKSKIKYKGYDSLYRIDLDSKKDTKYQVNLYPSIWRKSFFEKTVPTEENVWNYETSLTRIARETGAVCAMTRGSEYVILDVVRKGKLLGRAIKYFEKNPDLYHGDRKPLGSFEETKIRFMLFLKSVFPQSVIDVMKSVPRIFGMKYYSDSPGSNKR